LPGHFQTRSGTFDREFPIHFCQTGHDVKEESSEGYISVDCISKTFELNFFPLQVRNQIYQILDAAAQPVQFPHDEGVVFPQYLQAL